MTGNQPGKPYTTPPRAAAKLPSLYGALYYGRIHRGPVRHYVAIIEEQGDRLLAASATFHGWIDRAELLDRADDL